VDQGQVDLPNQVVVVAEAGSEDKDDRSRGVNDGEMGQGDDHMRAADETEDEEEEREAGEGGEEQAGTVGRLAETSISSPISAHAARSSKKRPYRASILETPIKKTKVPSFTAVKPRQSTVTVTPETSSDQSYWKEWDMKREAEIDHDVQRTGTVKAVRVWDRFCNRPGLDSASSEHLQGISSHRVNILVTMVLAVANPYAFGALKRATIAVQQDGMPSIADAFSNEPQRLFRTLTAIDTASETHGYMRRFTLARLAKLYRSTAANGGQLPTNDDDAWMSRRRPPTKVDKAKAYCSMIEHIWDRAFPDRDKGRTMTKSGLIDSDAPDAVRWNQCKRRLSKQIEAGQRWLQWAERLGWSSLGLISRDWSIGDSKVVASDRL
jgi:hypothetical protein